MKTALALAILHAVAVWPADSDAATDDLRLSIEESEWCGGAATLAFSIVNTGRSEVTVLVSPSKASADRIPLWPGTYSLMVDREGAARAVTCSATHGGVCVSERERLTLPPSTKKTWQLRSPYRWSKGRRAKQASLSIDFRMVPTDDGQGVLRELSWSGVLEISKMGSRHCWKIAAVQPGLADGPGPRLRSEPGR
jgi:hypothetical protein